MPWFKVDDNLAFHHKVIAAGNSAMGLWVRAGSACAQQLTDGFIHDHMIAALGTVAQAKRLVAVGLWNRVEGGYAFHGWEERQPSKANIEAERAAAADRMREFRAKKKGTSSNTSEQVSGSRVGNVQPNERRTNAEVREMFGNPDPTHPIPTHKDTTAIADAMPERFEDFWTTYDKKRGRKAAIGKYRLALKKPDVNPALLIHAAGEYIEWLRREGKHPEFTKDPATWLNGEHWNDERATSSNRPKVDPNWALRR